MCYGHLIQLLKQCTSLHIGRQIHKIVVVAENVYLSNLLLHMYGRCGSPEEALEVFNATTHRNSFSWSLLTAAYAQNGYMHEATFVFNQTPRKDVVCWNLMLSAYSEAGWTGQAQQIFQNSPQRNIVSWNSLAGAFAQNGDPDNASKAVLRMPMHDIISCNTSLLAAQEEGESELKACFNGMPERSCVSWSFIVQSFARRDQMHQARDFFVKMAHWSLHACNAMIAGYARAGNVQLAEKVFDSMGEHDVASWTSLMDSYAQCGMIECVKRVFFVDMPSRTVVSWTAMLAALARAELGDECRAFFEKMPQRNLVSWNTMITADAGCSASDAFSTFTKSPQKDLTSWNSILAVLAGHLKLVKAEQVLYKMPQHGLVSWNSMLSLYATLGLSSKASDFFQQQMPLKDIVSWSTLLSSSVNSGDLSHAMQVFQELNLEGGVEPDGACFTTLLAGFKDHGMLLECGSMFSSMLTDYGVAAVLEHYDCLVDALGRCGQLELARELLEVMTFVPGDVSKMAVMSACVSCSEVEVGSLVAQGIDDSHTAAVSRVVSSRMFAAAAGA